ncbi:MAG: TrbI/VirB10 family protein [bacterium]
MNINANGESFNKHVIKEEAVPAVNGGDAYNSDARGKDKFLKKDFFRFFRLPIIIIVFLISAAIVLKFLFFHKTNPAKIKKIMPKTSVIQDKKRFSPAVFDYTGNKGSDDGKGSAKSEGSGKFNDKFKKETEKLNRGIKFNNYPKQAQAAQINKKTVVFIEASYGKHILNMERGVKKSGSGKNRIKRQKTSLGGGLKNVVAVPQGTVINAYIKYKIFSYNTSVPVIAISSSGYYYDGESVFKKGDKFFGAVSLKHSLNRLNINFDKVIESSGRALTIDATAMMPDGSGGVKGNVHRHYTGNILTSIAQGVVGAASLFVGGGSGVNSSNPYTFQNQVRENVAQNELNSAQNGLNNYADSNQNISITLPAGTPVKIIFLKPVYVNQIKNYGRRK